MRTRPFLLPMSLCMAMVLFGCTSKPAQNGSSDSASSAPSAPAPASPAPANPDPNAPAANSATPSAPAQTAAAPAGTSPAPADAMKASTPVPSPAPAAAPPEPIVIASGRSVTIHLSSALGTKLSQAGQTFGGTVSRNVMAGTTVAIPKGARVTGTVVDAKPLGKLAGAGTLQVRLTSVNLNGGDLPVRTAIRTFEVKGKGKRTGIMAGGGAALGGIIGGIAGGGKGAAIGLAAGGGAGTGGAALTGNDDLVLPAESAVTFTLSKAVQIQP
jgi:hypothetical protein